MTPPSLITRPKILFFDLGMVLLRFDVNVMCRQVGVAAGIPAEAAHQALFESPLQRDYESGRVTTRQFYESFCRQTGARPDFDALLQAASDIFELNASMIPVVAHLYRGGWRLGLLSNTCACHWEHCLRRFRMLSELFDVHAVSFRIGAAKPDAAIFRAAADMAGAAPHEAFFTDDILGHVEGARAVGFDAVRYTTTPRLVADLQSRGVRLNL